MTLDIDGNDLEDQDWAVYRSERNKTQNININKEIINIINIPEQNKKSNTNIFCTQVNSKDDGKKYSENNYKLNINYEKKTDIAYDNLNDKNCSNSNYLLSDTQLGEKKNSNSKNLIQKINTLE